MIGLRVFPLADRDIDSAAEYYARKEGIELALRFLDALGRTFEFIRANPEAPPGYWSRNPDLCGIRRWPVSGFENCLVFYQRSGQWIEVVRILHGARDIEEILGGTR